MSCYYFLMYVILAIAGQMMVYDCESEDVEDKLYTVTHDRKSFRAPEIMKKIH